MDWKILDDRPIWQQLYRQLTQRIVAGIYPMGSRLPSVRELAAEAGVNPNTMQRALAALEQDGLVITNRTAGRLVTAEEPLLKRIRMELAREQIAAYLREMETLGFSAEDAKALLREE